MSFDPLYCVIVNWNLKEDTLACIQSLLDSGALANQMIVVDNGSTDGSVDSLRQRFSTDIQIIQNRQNLGYARGSNLGIQQALEKGAEWVLLINNDTLVSTSFLRELENVVENYGKFDIIGPLILHYDQPERIWFLGDRLIPGTLMTHSLYRGKAEQASYSQIFPVDFLTGCAMLVNRKVFEKVGFLDTELFMYGEDVDFCWRARSAGFRLAAAPRAKMWHKVSISANREKSTFRYLRIRNQNRFYRLNSHGIQVPLMLALSLYQLIWKASSDIIHFQPKMVAPLVRGWVDGWLNPHQTVRANYGIHEL
ncbi:MAG TPA: glycosyltransferase family 2 protein [Anaerolineales bacterium]|nr:glycosyltransferase family 2 protein [Anaerolineales bacterium]